MRTTSCAGIVRSCLLSLMGWSRGSGREAGAERADRIGLSTSAWVRRLGALRLCLREVQATTGKTVANVSGASSRQLGARLQRIRRTEVWRRPMDGGRGVAEHWVGKCLVVGL